MGFLIYDGIVVGVLALFTWFGWRRGLLLSLCGLAVALFAFWGAGFLADTLDTPISNAIAPKLEETIHSALEKKAEEIGLVDYFSSDTAADVLRDMGGLYRWGADDVENTLKSTVTNSIADQTTAAALSIARQLSHSVIFFAAFVALCILFNLLLHALNIVAKLPGLHFCNGLGGGVIGLVKGGVFVFVAVGAATLLFSAYLPDAQTMERSRIFRFFVENNPITSLFAG